MKNARDEEVEGVTSKVSNSNPSTSFVVYARDRLCIWLVVTVRGGEGGCNSIGGNRGIVGAAVEETDRVGVLRRVVSDGKKKGACSCWKSTPSFGQPSLEDSSDFLGLDLDLDSFRGRLFVDDAMDGGREWREVELDLTGVAGEEVVGPPVTPPPLGKDKEAALRRSIVEVWDEVER